MITSWRLLLDQNIRLEVLQHLKKLGIDAIHASNIGLQTAPDPEVLRYAISENRVLVTRDSDFGDLKIFILPQFYPGVIRIKIISPLPASILEVLLNFMNKYPPDYIRNSLVILTTSKVRIRRTTFLE